MAFQIDGSAPFIESVVHATDFSPASERAFAHALAIAVIARARIEILHVGTERETDWQRFPHVRGVLERWGLLPPGSCGECRRKARCAGHQGIDASRFPAVAITTRLEEEPADLLVVATEGRDGAARWLHGSVAEAMSRWSRTMTLFVPNELDRSIVSVADGRLTLNNVLIPVDHSPDRAPRSNSPRASPRSPVTATSRSRCCTSAPTAAPCRAWTLPTAPAGRSAGCDATVIRSTRSRLPQNLSKPT